MRWVLMAMLGGCSFSTSVSDQPGAEMPPPIDAVPIDMAIDGSPNLDTDGDGILDSVDKCPMTNSQNQHDEDADNVGDICDLCPQIAVATADGDNDKIGDLCDPHPATTGDVLVRFETFAGTTLPAGWTLAAVTAGNLAFGNDELSINAASGTHILLFDTTDQQHAIDVGVRLPNDNTNTTFFTALTDVKSDLAEYMGCGLRLDTETRELFSYNDPSFATAGADPTPADAPMFPATHRIASVLANNSQRCVIPKGNNQHEITGTANTRNRTFVGVRVGDVTAAVRYIAVYRF